MTPAEILIAASKNVGRNIAKSYGAIEPMTMADAIADMCPGNPEGALEAFRLLHEASGAIDLIAWSSGQTNYQLATFMREVGRKATQ